MKVRNDRISILIVRGGNQSTQRIELRKRWLQYGGAFVAIFLTVFTVNSIGFVKYWQEYQSTESIRVANAKFDQERSVLTARLLNLAESVERAERVAARLESTESIPQTGVMTQGIGPISETTVDTRVATSNEVVESLKPHTEESNHNFSLLDLQEKMDALDNVARSAEDRLQKVYNVKKQRNAFWAALPTNWPVNGWVTSSYGPRRAPTRGATSFHEGVDVAAPVGTPVYASGDGVVTYSGYKGGFGKTIMIDHGFGIASVYGHNAILFVKEGERVRRGMKLAVVGMTGRTTGPHLHYEVRVDGMPVDPMRYLTSRR